MSPPLTLFMLNKHCTFTLNNQPKSDYMYLNPPLTSILILIIYLTEFISLKNSLTP